MPSQVTLLTVSGTSVTGQPATTAPSITRTSATVTVIASRASRSTWALRAAP